MKKLLIIGLCFFGLNATAKTFNPATPAPPDYNTVDNSYCNNICKANEECTATDTGHHLCLPKITS